MQTDTRNPKGTEGEARGNYVSLNGLKMYYEVQGKGMPLVLLHGGLADTGMFSQLLPALEGYCQTISVDLQWHGRTADIDRPMSFEQMADDIAALINHLELETVDVLGYSLGGGVALQTTLRHPKLIRKAVLVSTPFKSEGWYPEVRAGMRAMNAEAAKAMVGSPPHKVYVNIAPRPDDWPMLVTRVGGLISQQYDWSKEIPDIRVQVMVVAGDADAVRTSHAVQFFELLGGGQADAGWDGSNMPNARLAILPGTNHYNILFSPLFTSIVLPFLEAPAKAG
jgi:pimeloyl-ACP methyl ester carboxylesterase